jgi:hypothetical protein
VLADAVQALEMHDKPLVYTAYEAHHLDRTAHTEQQDVLVPAADALITLRC